MRLHTFAASLFGSGILLFAIPACSHKEETPLAQAANNAKGVAPSVGPAKAAAMSKVAELKKKQVDLAAQIEDIKKKCESASADAKAAVTAVLPQLEKARDAITSRIAKIASDGGGNLQEMMKGVSVSIDDLQKKVNETLEKLK
jgi:molecular chaperone GrpE (heat shock protein)